jgi:clan AA aspartic protease
MTPTFDIEVIGSRGSILVSALVDTGFNGELCLPVNLAITLGFELIDQVFVEFADGRRERQLVFSGTVRFLDEERPVDLFVTDSDDTLIGTELLADCTLFVDFTTGETRIEKKEPVGA